MAGLQVALIGNPNAGKSALFNCLTGQSSKVANHPGITVDVHTGRLQGIKSHVQIVDLPGTYSLDPHSDDERVVANYLAGNQPGLAPAGLFLAVVDALHLERNLFLLTQLKCCDRPIIVALTFWDEAKKILPPQKIARLSRNTGLTLYPVSSKTGEGLVALKNGIESALTASTEITRPGNINVPCEALDPQAQYLVVRKWLEGIRQPPEIIETKSDQVDKWLLHPVFGFVALLGIFFGLVWALFAGAQPLIQFIEASNGHVASMMRNVLPQGWLLSSLIVDGIIEGVGSVLVFVPLIAILFFLMGFLEDSGYMARASFLLDKFMHKAGLPTKAFAPLASGIACAVPAILATRTMGSQKDRLLTILVAPFMTCSARLPVYALFIGLLLLEAPTVFGFIPAGPLLLFSMYGFGVFMTALAAIVLRKTILTGPRAPLILELPPYRWPQILPLVAQVRIKIQVFLKEVGTIILALTIIMWALFTFPRTDVNPSLSPAQASQVQIENSFAGQIGKFLEPAIAPLGFDWKMGIGLIASFAAREVFIATLGVANGIGRGHDENSLSLRESLQREKNPITGKPLYTPLVILSLMLFFALALQCMSTLAVTRKETGSWKWPLFQLAAMSSIAWATSFLFYQAGTAMGFQ